ncbi:MAG: TadE/TadG family type IV pilus assembly protein [Acidimicrobiia bacterium]
MSTASAAAGPPDNTTSPAAGSRLQGEQGQAAVEFALSLPLVMLVLLAVVQVGLLARDQVLVTHAAREGARAAAVDDAPEAAGDAARSATALDGDRLEVHAAGRAGPGSRVAVKVGYRAPTTVPLVGGLLDDVYLEAEATMRVE